jgi:hypothetical protein
MTKESQELQQELRQQLQEADVKSIRSAKALRNALEKEIKSSPLHDLSLYYRTSNELQMYCSALSASASDDQKYLLKEMEEVVKNTKYFHSAERFNQICEWRIDEMLHAPWRVASIWTPR